MLWPSSSLRPLLSCLGVASSFSRLPLGNSCRTAKGDGSTRTPARATTTKHLLAFELSIPVCCSPHPNLEERFATRFWLRRATRFGNYAGRGGGKRKCSRLVSGLKRRYDALMWAFEAVFASTRLGHTLQSLRICVSSLLDGGLSLSTRYVVGILLKGVGAITEESISVSIRLTESFHSLFAHSNEPPLTGKRRISTLPIHAYPNGRR